MTVIKVTKSNFESEVINSEKPVLVDFFAEWCSPCKMLSTVIDNLNLTDTKVCKINIDEEQELAAQFNVRSIPTLAVFKDGSLVKREVGFKTNDKILEMLHG